MAVLDKAKASPQIGIVSLFSFFARERYLQRYITTLAKNDIVTIGDLEKYSEDELFSKFPTSDSNKKTFVRDLKGVGVRL